MDKKDRRRKRRLLERLKIEVEKDRRASNEQWSIWDLSVGDIDQHRWIRAQSFTFPELFNTEPYFPGGAAKYVASPQGTWAYSNRVLPHPIPLPSFDNETFTFFDGNVVIPSLSDLWKSREGEPFDPKQMTEKQRFIEGAVWMGLTPAEMLTQRSGIRMAKGKVLIGGLGLGWFLEEVCKKDEVEEVVLVERSQELLDWYGYRLCQAQPKVKDVICNDVYAVVDRFPDHQYLLDIWPVFHGEFGAVGDRRLADLRLRAPGRVWAWGMD